MLVQWALSCSHVPTEDTSVGSKSRSGWAGTERAACQAVAHRMPFCQGLEVSAVGFLCHRLCPHHSALRKAATGPHGNTWVWLCQHKYKTLHWVDQPQEDELKGVIAIRPSPLVWTPFGQLVFTHPHSLTKTAAFAEAVAHNENVTSALVEDVSLSVACGIFSS